MINADISIVAPEIALAVFAMAALMFGVYTTKDKVAPLILWATSAVMAALGIWIALSPAGAQTAFNGAFVDDAFSRFAKVTILLAASSVLVMSKDYMQRRDLLRFEYPILVALSVVGMMMMVSAGDLMALYMGLELQSLALYVVAALNRDSLKSTEAGLKYFVLGALSSGILLYGASLVYGFAGTTVFSGIMASAGESIPLGLLFGLTFVIMGLAFKVSAVPFHMWTPDVYEGSPTPVTAFFATAPKMAAMGLFARVVHDAFGMAVADWSQIIALLAVLSMFLGAVAAIGQRNIKRMMAYSSISHMGFAADGLGDRHRTWRAGDAGLHGNLHHHEHRHLCLHPVDGKRWTACDRYFCAEPILHTRAPQGAGDVGFVVLAGWCAADGRILWQVLCATGCGGCQYGMAGDCRCDRLSDRRILLSAHRLLHVLWRCE